MQTLLALLGIWLVASAAAAAVVKILYPNGDALDQENRRRKAEEDGAS